MSDALDIAKSMMADISRESALGFHNALMAIRLEMEGRGLLLSGIYRDRLLQLGREEIAARADRHWQAMNEALRAAGEAITDELAEEICTSLKNATQADANFVQEALRRELSPHALSVTPQDFRGQQDLIASRQLTHVKLLRLQFGAKDGARSSGGEIAVADQDHLTGTLLRRKLDEDLPALLERANGEGVPLGLVMVDVDHFKKINDGYSHPKGDSVLRGVCQRLVLVASSKGRVYRYGGEEFTIILFNHSVEEAIAVAERARRSIESEPIEEIAVTASFGVAAFPVHGADPASLIEAADQALRDAKALGRNVVRVSGELEPVAGPRQPERRHPEAGKLTETERVTIREDFFRSRSALCPRDGALLVIAKDHTTGRNPRLFVTCPNCGLTDEA